jgi:hypothetical protein
VDAIGAHAQGLAEAGGDEADYLKFLKSLVGYFDRAMTAEGVDPDVRDRVVSRVLYGVPTPEAPADLGGRRIWSMPPVNG